MGQGILEVIPVSFSINRGREDSLPKEFMDAYEPNPEEPGLYKIRKEMLFRHFRELYISVNALLGKNRESWVDKRWDALEALAADDDLEGYLRYLKEKSNTGNPSYWPNAYSDDLKLEIRTEIHICRGSYKALLEEYTTLEHLNILFPKAFPDNPLARAVRFVLFG